MPQDQVIARYYPTLDTVVTLEELPEFLNFLKEGLSSIFGKIHYRDLQFSRSPYGDAAFYSLDIVSKRRLDIELPGADIFIVLNPEVDDSGISSFPITIQYQWPILAYIRSFNLDNFNFSPEAFYDLALQILKIPEGQVVANGINTFTVINNNTPIEQFVIDINTQYGTSITVSTDPNPMPQLLIDMETAVGQPPGISVYETYILNNNNSEETKKKLNLFFKSLLPTNDVESYIKELILPKFSATLELSAAIEFPRWMLLPVDENTLEVIPEEGNTGYPRVSLRFGEALLYAGTEEGINYNIDLNATLSQPAQIGKTGVIINIENLKLDLSREENIPEADADGRPADFMGVYAAEVSAILPKKWFNNVDESTLKLAGYDILVGTGGLSGTIALETISGNPNNGNATLDVQIGNWKLGFSYFNLVFQQNSIIESNIQGQLTIPKLKDAQNNDALITLSGHLNEEGDFNLTASEPEGIPFTLFDFVTFNFLTLELGRENDDFYIGTSCQIWFDNPIMNKLLNGQIIEIPRLRIYDNGSIEIVGGNGFIPTNISLDLGPIEVAVTGIHYGATQQEYNGDMRRYNYWGFDGAISLDPLGIDARGEGIKYYYTTDNDEFGGTGNSFIRIQTIEVDLIIPGTASPESALAIIRGMLSIPEPGDSQEYRGEVSVKLPKARIAGGAAMRLQPRHPAFILEVGVELGSPIPLGATGLGFYGFGGLIGYRYVADKAAVGLSEDDTWYDYFTHPQRGVNLDKFTGPNDLDNFENPEYNNAFSIGAGTVLATIFDDGYLFSTRLMAILSLPQVFILDGRANVLGDRLEVLSNDEPPFFAFVAIGNDSIEFGFGADYQIQKSNGWILDLYAEAQAGFFFNNSSAWYVNFGTRNNPITATLFKSLLNLRAQSYLMLSAQGMEAGARLDFDLRKRFGPFKVHIWAYLEVGGHISFERPQIGGYIAAGGGIDIDVWIIGISLALDAIFSAEAPKPFRIYAEVSFRACVKLGFFKICKGFTVKLKWEKNNMVDRSPVKPLPDNRVDDLVKGIHMLTNESFDLHKVSGIPNVGQINHIIPLDTYIEFKTEKGLVPIQVSGDGKIGGYTFPPENHVDLIPPEKVVRGGLELRQVKHKYSIEDLEIKAWNGNSWMDYHPFEAVVPAETRPDVDHLRVGYWQLKGKQYDTVRLLATTPFTYLEPGEPGWVIPEQFGITPSTLFCSEELREEDCSDVLNKTLGTKYYPPTQFVGHFINGAYYTLANVSGFEIIDGNIVIVDSEYMEVTDAKNVHGFEKSLSFNNYNRMVVILPEASIRVRLKLTTDAQGVTIKYYKSIIDDLTSVVTYQLVHEQYKTMAELDNEVVYENMNDPMTKVEIIPDDPDIEAILDILEQIAQLFEITYDGASGSVNISEPSDLALYNQLLAQLEALKAVSCSDKGDDGDSNGGDDGGGDDGGGDAGGGDIGANPGGNPGGDPGGGTGGGSSCSPDPEICAIYDQLVVLFENCFVPVQTSEEVDNNIPCFIEFRTLVELVLEFQPTLELLEEYEVYFAILEQIESLVGHHEQILRFNNLKASAQRLLDIIKALGCCDGTPPDKCDTSLQQICWMTLENHEWNETIPGSAAIEEEFQAMVEGMQVTAQPIWRPNTITSSLL